MELTGVSDLKLAARIRLHPYALFLCRLPRGTDYHIEPAHSYPRRLDDLAYQIHQPGFPNALLKFLWNRWIASRKDSVHATIPWWTAI